MNGIGICKWCGDTARTYTGSYQSYCSERCSFGHSESIRIKREREEKLEREGYLSQQREHNNSKNKTYISLNEVNRIGDVINKYKSQKDSTKTETIIIRKENDFNNLNTDEDQRPPNKGEDSYIDNIFKVFKGFFS